ncbi:alpha/beta hydrolase [Stakelama sediminis]|uniref:Pimeloyl-ACP methyl ester carboxylesterase n=1 Tax=Stakelama sediminis TaxID=463200 RepID=A0A840Z0X5_9SPHN|nr:alpha/beta fold hydrolase [Stakelama sediminis]MBB5719575.1 pimeloyl-ACP methyl ester carboxylesterase [Stakelama sediminis]
MALSFAGFGRGAVDAGVLPRHLPPSRGQMLAEWPRGLWSLASLAVSRRALDAAPAGDGRPVLLLPGLINSDSSNLFLRRYLHRIGYRAYRWKLGRNFGTRTVGADAEKLIARIEHIAGKTGAPVTLIGVSLGGIMARLAAHRRPDLVREVITISSPFAGPATATNVWRTFERVSGDRIDDPRMKAMQAEAASPLPVPATAIWSASDGLVNGLICRAEDGHCRNVEVRSSHVGVQVNPAVLRLVADLLAGTTD